MRFVLQKHSYTRQQNDIAEPMNRTLLNMTRMLKPKNISEEFWGDGVVTAA